MNAEGDEQRWVFNIGCQWECLRDSVAVQNELIEG